jgi:hypothetical protein
LSHASEESAINGYRDSKLSGSDIAGGSTTSIPEEEYDGKTASSNLEEKTEVIYGDKNVIKWVLRTLPTVTKSIDQCGDRNGPSILLLNEEIWQKHIDMHNRGVRQRIVTEITKENIIHCKKIMQFLEVRHLDGIIGYFSALDGRLITSTAYGEENKILPHLVTSTVKVLVDQHRYFFETLWNKAIPAKKRIREIEEGAKREFVETIRDPSEIRKIGSGLIKAAEERIDVLFSTPNAFPFLEKEGGEALDLLKEAASSPLRNVKIRILIAAKDSNTYEMTAATTHQTTTTMTNERTIPQFKESGIDVRRISQKLQEKFLRDSNLTLLIVDQSSFLTLELNNDANDTSEEDAIELAIYSNTDSTAFAYISIFENLWMQAQV